MQKNKIQTLLKWFKKAGNKLFQVVFDAFLNVVANIITKISALVALRRDKQEHKKQETNKPCLPAGRLKIKKTKLKIEKPKAFKSLRFKNSNLRFACFLCPCILFLKKTTKKLFKFCFSTKLRSALSLVLIASLLTSTFFLFKKPGQSLADYTNNVNQADWSGGEDTSSTVTPSTADGWNKYYDAGSTITADASGVQVTPSSSSATIDFTTEGNYAQEDDTKTEITSGTANLKDQFVCGTSTVQDSDGNTYSTVQIGDQCWMGENINVGTRISGASDQTDNSTIEKYCYSDSDSNCETYGGLYQWDEAMQYSTTEGVQGICADDWHIPTDAEQYILEDYLATGTCDSTRNGSWDCEPAGTDLKSGGSSGFEGLMAGRRTTSGSFGNLSDYAYFWSSSFSDSNAWLRYLNPTNSTVLRNAGDQEYGFSVRCLRDDINVYPTAPTYITTTDSSQINTSTYSQISGISLTQTTPDNTDLKYLVSFDDRTTWKYWDGDSWETATLDDLQTYGNSKTELEALDSDDWGLSLADTLDFAVDLSTSDDTATPELDRIEVNYKYYPTSTDTIDFTTEGNYTQEDSAYTDINGSVSLAEVNQGVLFIDGEDTIEDDSGSATTHTITANGDAAISTSNKKYGSSSIYFDGTGDYLQLEDSSDWSFGTEDFTVDFWLNLTSTSDEFRIYGIGLIANGSTYSGAGFYKDGLQYKYPWTPQVDTWHHVAFVRYGGSFDVYIDGIKISGESMTGTFSSETSFDSTNVQLGKWSTSYSKGYLDNFRITKGEALWKSNFNVNVDLEYGYPTTPTYITTTDSSQINTSTYSQISGVSLTQTTPTNTDLKYLVSFDDRTTWKYWNGSGWTTATLDDLQTYGNSKTELEALDSDDWGLSLADTLDFAVDLSTSDDTATPEIDQIQISYIPEANEATTDFGTEGDYIQENSSYTDITGGDITLTGPTYSTTPYYVTTSDTSQEDVTDWIQINGVAVTQTTPTNTDLKYLVSFDDRTTWKYWNGSGWTTATLDDLQTYGNSKTELEALDSDDWDATGGFTAGSTTTLDFAVDLSTTDSSSTPTLFDLTFLYSEGLISSKFNTESIKNTMGGLTWDEDETLPEGSEVSIALRTADSEANLDTANWTTIGTSTPTSLTTGCTKSGTTVTCNSTTIPDAMKTGNDDQWFQYKLSLTTGVNSPTVTNINPIYEQDVTAPTITSITSTTTDGAYKEGDEINITLNFSEDVTSSTGLTITFDTGATANIPAWTTKSSSVSGTYTATSTETSDLTVTDITGTINDQPTNSVMTGNTVSIPFTTEGNYVEEDDVKTQIVNGEFSLFTCGTSTVQDSEENTYSTVQIGDQCWTGENMNIGTRVDGSNSQTDNSTIEKYCYGDNESNCDTYGGLYQWDEAMQYTEAEGAQGICPSGWHIPTDAEQHTLDDYLATGTCDSTRSDSWDCDPAGTALKSGGSSGFEGLLAGILTGGSFYNISLNALFWSSSQYSSANAWSRYLDSTTSTVYRSNYVQTNGFSVRCVKDSESPSSYYVTTTDDSQISVSNWNSLDDFTITETTPAGTDLKYLVSFDERTTWKYWDGDSWEEASVDGYTGDQCVGGVASASSEYSATYSADKAFDDSDVNYWNNDSGQTGWLKYDFGLGNEKNIKKYAIQASSSGDPNKNNMPKNWTFEGSNDDSNWTILDTQTGAASWADSEEREYTFNNEISYRYYRVNITETITNNWASIGEVKMMEAASDISIAGNTSTELEALTEADWTSTGGLSLSSDTIDFVVDLSTTDDTVTPSLDNIEFEYTEIDNNYTNSTTDPDHATSNLANNAALVIDNTVPSSTITTPDGTTEEYSGMATLSGTATDTVAVENVDITIQNDSDSNYWTGSEWSATETWLTTTGTTSWSYDSSGVTWTPDISYTVISRATDTAGNVETPGTGNSFTFVNSAPTVSNVTAAKTTTDTTISYDVTDIESSDTTITLAYSSGATLGSDIDSTETTDVSVSDATNFPDSGTIFMQHGTGDSIRYEYISYSGKSGNTLTGITRAQNSTLGYSHATGATIYIKAESLTGDVGTVTNGTGKSITWDTATDNDTLYETTQTVVVIANDGASANKMGAGVSSEFTLDSKTPTIDTTSYIDATVSPAQLTLDVSDDTSIEMMISLNSDFSGASWESYAADPTIALASNPDNIYLKFRDSQENTTSTETITTPNTPESLMIQDVSSDTLDKWKLYTSWQIISEPSPGFESYNVYRSATEDGTYTLRGSTASGDRTVDYYSDTVEENDDYYYRIASEDSDGNISVFSDAIHAIANAVQDEEEGGGGESGDSTAPTISAGPTVATTTSNSATITWTTDEAADSYIEYGTDTNYGEVYGDSTATTDHSVVLPSNLAEGATYHYRVRTRDSAGNLTTSTDSTFTTTASPVISNVATPSLTDDEVTITFDTLPTSYGYIDYGTATGAYTKTGGELTSGTEHSITLSNLTASTTYYYQVRIKDIYGDYTTESVERSFTTNSGAAPTLSSFTSTTEDGSYKEGDTINITATYSETIDSGSIIVELDTGAQVTLDSIATDTVSGTYTVSSNQDSSDLTVETIVLQNVCDSDENCVTNVTLPDTNIDDGSDIVVDTTDPVFSSLSPSSSSSIDNLTTASDIAYTLVEDLTSGLITITRTGGEVDSSSPHTCTLTGSYLNAGTHSSFDTTDCTEGAITLVEGGIYTFTFVGEDLVGNTNSQDSTSVTFTTTDGISISSTDSTPDSDSVTITFTTSEAAYGYIDYGTTDSYGKVQGNNTQTATDHSITIEGLTADTGYHFRVRVKSLAGDYTLGDDETFTTDEEAEEPSEDGPTISEISVSSISYDSAVVEWETDEDSNSLVDYGTSVEYGRSEGDRSSSTTAHIVSLSGLSSETKYYFRVSSKNGVGGETVSSGSTFTTLAGSEDQDDDGEGDQISDIASEIQTMIDNLTYTEEEIMDAISNIEAISISSSGVDDSIEDNTDVTISWETNKPAKGKVVYKQEDQDTWTNKQETFEDEDADEYVEEHEVLLKNLEPQTTYEYYVISTSILGNQVTSDTETFTTGETPKISNILVNSTSLNEATISWTTVSIEESILEYGTSTDYGDEKTETSSTDESDQTVLLTDLTPGEEYHFRIKGIDEDGETTTSGDNTFITSALPNISDVDTENITTEGATITWSTNEPTDSLVEYSFEDEEEGTSQGILEATTDHSITLTDLIPGARYRATVRSKDQFGNQAESEQFTFQTEEDNNPPQIQNISSDTTMYPGEDLKIQTVISWITSKDSYSAIAFRKGAGKSNIDQKLQEIVQEEGEDIITTNYEEWTIIKKPVLAKNHLFILTDFEPSSVYQYKVISVDKRGNTSVSKDYSFLTPSKQESIFDLIIANFEDTFGWVRNIN